MMSKIPLLRGMLAGLLLFTCGVSTASAHEAEVFYVGRLWPGGVSRPIDDAVMIVDHGKIAWVGPRADAKIPAGAKKHDLRDAVVIPGLVVAETSLGVSSDDERTLTPEVRAVDGFDFYADYTSYIAGGVTTVQLAPGRTRLMPGQGSVVKLAGESPGDRILSDNESLRINLTSESANPPRIYEPPVGAVSVDNPLKPTRPQISGSLSARFAGLNAVFKVAREMSDGGGEELGLDTISDYASKGGRLRAKAQTTAEIRAAVRLAQMHKMKLLLVDPRELDVFTSQASDLGSTLGGVILNAGLRPGTITNPGVPDPEAPKNRSVWEHAARLAAKGLAEKLAIRPASDTDLDDMLFVGGLFTRAGNSAATVLNMLTSNPAAMMGVGDRVGTLAAGRDADFVVLNNDPFAAGASVLATWIDGKSKYDRERENRITVIKAASVYTGDGHVMSNASVVIGGKKVRGLGPDVSAPADARLKRFRNGVIVPGFIDLSTGLGLGGTVGSLSLSTKVGDRLVADDPAVEFARRGGVTTAVLGTSGSPGSLLAFKLGETPRVLKEPVGIRFSMPTTLTSGLTGLKSTLTRAKTYVDAWNKYEKDMVVYKEKLKEYEVAKAKYDAKKKAEEAKKKAEEARKAAAAKAAGAKPAEKKTETPKPGEKKDEKKPASGTPAAKPTAKPAEKKTTEKKDEKKPAAKPKVDPDAPKKPTEPKKPSTSASMEPYRALFAGKIPALVEANTVKQIQAAVKLFREEFKLRTILVGGNELYRVPDLIADNGLGASVGPTLIQQVDNKTFNLPQILSNHQIDFGFQSKATTGVRQLPLAVQYSVHKGLGRGDALTGFTAGPSKLLSLDAQVGSIAVGKDADLVVLSGPPFEISSEVIAVMIDGQWVYEKEMDQ